MNSITIPQKDLGYAIAFTVQFANTSAVNLSGYNINMKTWAPTNPSVLLVNGVCNAVNTSLGTCSYTLKSGDFNTVGTYYAELELIQANVVESTETFKVLIAESG